MPMERMSAFTCSAPAYVEPASQTSSAFAAASSDGMIISLSRPPTYEVGGGIPECRARTAVAIASFSVEAAGKCAFAFQAAPAPSVRLWT